jgi:hypothetical protein
MVATDYLQYRCLSEKHKDERKKPFVNQSPCLYLNVENKTPYKNVHNTKSLEELCLDVAHYLAKKNNVYNVSETDFVSVLRYSKQLLTPYSPSNKAYLYH